MKSTFKVAITVDSNVKDCYDLRDSVAAALISMNQVWLSETDDTKIEFQIVEVVMPKAGHYDFTPSRRGSLGSIPNKYKSPRVR